MNLQTYCTRFFSRSSSLVFLYGWTSKAPVMLFHAPGDDIVPALNSAAEQAIKPEEDQPH